MTQEVSDRVERLRGDLEKERDHYLNLGRRNYFAAYGLVVVTVIASASAGILGLFSNIDGKLVGLIALIPAILAGFGNQLKLQARADWHYRKYDALKALLRRLNYELPEAPTAEHISEISKAISKIEADMTATWEQALSFKFDPPKVEGKAMEKVENGQAG